MLYSTTLKYSLLLLLTVLVGYACGTSKAVSSETSKEIEQLLKNRNFMFQAQTANPLRGGVVQLTTPYDLKVKGDSLVSFLPYFGRAFTAQYNQINSPLDYKSVNFTYSIKERRNGGWEIAILQQDDPRDQKQMYLTVSENGYANLRISSVNREPITFNGIVRPITS